MQLAQAGIAIILLIAIIVVVVDVLQAISSQIPAIAPAPPPRPPFENPLILAGFAIVALLIALYTWALRSAGLSPACAAGSRVAGGGSGARAGDDAPARTKHTDCY